MTQQITTNMRQYLGSRPDLKFLFFGGKGGVGKTVMAAATAVSGGDAARATSTIRVTLAHTRMVASDTLIISHIRPDRAAC